MIGGVRLCVAVAASAIVAGILSATYAIGYQRAISQERSAILTKSVDVLRDRVKVNEKTKSLDDAALCRALGGEWMQDSRTCQ